jgi:hypothetical protein
MIIIKYAVGIFFADKIDILLGKIFLWYSWKNFRNVRKNFFKIYTHEEGSPEITEHIELLDQHLDLLRKTKNQIQENIHLFENLNLFIITINYDFKSLAMIVATYERFILIFEQQKQLLQKHLEQIGA